MVYAISLNTSLDYDIYTAGFSKGGLNQAKEIRFRAAGKGISVSRALHHLGIETEVIGFVGGFTGAFIESEMKRLDLSHDFIHVEGATRINVKLNDGETETEISGITSPISQKAMDLMFTKLQKPKAGDYVVFSGSLPQGAGEDAYLCLSKSLKPGVRTILDTRGFLLLDNIYNNLLIKPNIHELSEMWGKDLKSRKDVIAACGILLQKGVENVIVSMGGDGAMLVSQDCRLMAKAPQGKFVNSIGAGDSVVAGFLSGLIKGTDKKTAFRLGVAAGSATAFSPDIGEAGLIYELFKKVNVEEL